MDGKKSPYKWRNRDVLTFLRHYKQMECLWNNRLPEYKDKTKRERAYEAIQQNMDMELSVPDIKNKIKGIRTTYSTEINKILKSSRSGSEEIYKPRVFWFSLAHSFLKDVTETRTSRSMREDHSNASDTSIPYQMPDEEVDPFSLDQFPLESSPVSSRKSSRSYQVHQDIPKMEEIAGLQYKEEDEFDLFGRSMAIQLKKLPEHAALELMQQMQLMMNNARLAHSLENKAEQS
ncbi:hypothetical protein EVAR_45788_1 [Eumeta japonica]|uniref:MADF domain-containing protein n=1 Tax=Eumeta variegata TaxID=151549 RepID=A0A4C1X1J5_EUMVA|nr:hypothetical protein EVAR_45788_1 [Eumeta japonica]